MNRHIKTLAILAGIFFSRSSYAIIPTADIPGTIQAATEVSNTINNVKESITQVTQYQKTMAAIGTAKKSVSEFISNQKEKLQEKLDKIEEYKKKAEEYKAMALSYKEEAEERVAYYKGLAEDTIDTAKEYKAMAEEGIETVKDVSNTVVDTVENADEIAAGVSSNIENQVNGAVDSAQSDFAIDGDLLGTGNNAQEATPTPTRSTFQSSFLTPHRIKTSYPLAFASILEIDALKGGSTPDKVLIVPDSISVYCDLNYEEAAEEGKFDECLTEINQKLNSEVSDGADMQEKSTVRTDFMNGYIEYVTASFLEAFAIYNESLTFKNNMVDPVTTSNMETVDSAWAYAKEMNRIIGTRYNSLRRLWARQLGIQSYNSYIYADLPQEEEE